jgi:hypothetical protein
LQEKEGELKITKQILDFLEMIWEKKIECCREKCVLREHSIYSEPFFTDIWDKVGHIQVKPTLFWFEDLGLPSIIVAGIAYVVCYTILARGLLAPALEIVKAAQSSMVKEPQRLQGLY